MTTTDPGADKAVQAWYALYRRAINEANGLTNYVEDRPELRSAEKRIARIEEEARAITAAPPAQPQSEPLAMDLLRTDFKRECDDTDMILRMLGLEPENCRTDGGSLKTGMILDALQARDRLLQRLALAAQPPERAAQQETQEAVARVSGVHANFAAVDWLPKAKRLGVGDYVYAAPPRAVEPMPALTDAEIAAAWKAWPKTAITSAASAIQFVRGIGKQGQG